MSNTKQITIIGATGNLGVPTVKNLVNLGFSVKAIVRNEEKAIHCFGHSNNVELVKADLTDINTLKAALLKTEYLYLNLSSNTLDRTIEFATEREGVANILKAVDRENIKQIICISGLGAFNNVHLPGNFEFIPNIIRKEGHKLIKESGIAYTILHCTNFIDNTIIYQRKGTYSIVGNPNGLSYFTNCYDYSVQLANAIGNRDTFFQEFAIQGEEALPHIEAAKKFLAIYAPTVKVRPLSTGMLKILSLFIKEMKFIKYMAEYFSQMNEEFLAEESKTYKILGAPQFGIELYAEKLKTDNVYKQQ